MRDVLQWLEPSGAEFCDDEGSTAGMAWSSLRQAWQGRKDGNDALTAGSFAAARDAYLQAQNLLARAVRFMRLEGIAETDPHESACFKQAADTVQVALQSNLSLACLRLGDFQAAWRHADESLAVERSNAKALYRRAAASLELGKRADAEADLRAALALGASREVRALLERCRLGGHPDQIIHCSSDGRSCSSDSGDLQHNNAAWDSSSLHATGINRLQRVTNNQESDSNIDQSSSTQSNKDTAGNSNIQQSTINNITNTANNNGNNHSNSHNDNLSSINNNTSINSNIAVTVTSTSTSIRTITCTSHQNTSSNINACNNVETGIKTTNDRLGILPPTTNDDLSVALEIGGCGASNRAASVCAVHAQCSVEVLGLVEVSEEKVLQYEQQWQERQHKLWADILAHDLTLQTRLSLQSGMDACRALQILASKPPGALASADLPCFVSSASQSSLLLILCASSRQTSEAASEKVSEVEEASVAFEPHLEDPPSGEAKQSETKSFRRKEGEEDEESADGSGSTIFESWLGLAAFLLRHVDPKNSKTKALLCERDSCGRTPLHLLAACRPRGTAAERTAAELMEVLLDAGAQVDLADADERTPLHLAAAAGHTQAVSLLLDAACSADLQDRHKRTPLYYAALQNHREVVALLVNRGHADQSILFHALKEKFGTHNFMLHDWPEYNGSWMSSLEGRAKDLPLRPARQLPLSPCE
ncbi:unnamed protein product, partial [Polarella glacialis]